MNTERITLAPSGVDPWSDEVQIVAGCLHLLWKRGDEEFVKTFTSEQTQRLWAFLEQNRHAITNERRTHRDTE